MPARFEFSWKFLQSHYINAKLVLTACNFSDWGEPVKAVLLCVTGKHIVLSNTGYK
jgi:hypothetical protein